MVGAEHSETLIARSNLGMLLKLKLHGSPHRCVRNSRGRFAEAEEHARRAWEESGKTSADSAETHVFAVHLAMEPGMQQMEAVRARCRGAA